jgi:hypothetical protein
LLALAGRMVQRTLQISEKALGASHVHGGFRARRWAPPPRRQLAGVLVNPVDCRQRIFSRA